ncbi:cation:proton antiporter [Flavobacterium azooxidireducens]|uniref:Cation:proton antiporter n=1 Tax=Flavobacterium azooxidireducens TaxID=1871076 RepID=A0ABY4KHL6_9FLAO|nr:cation:proton antiporter [Flavobacterium azooxidireducens]UPQ80281.1 cation:proton antiporter [Flavobacterium azooxidireducens]
MKNFKNSFFYILIIGGFSALMYWIAVQGEKLEYNRNIEVVSTNLSQWDSFLESITHNIHHPLAILLAQIVTIILVARMFGWICKKIGQPSVIGEIIAGIVLGPSLFGMYFPEFSANLFPAESLGNLQFLSQIGLILFMFVIGMELDLKVLQNKAHDAVVVSHASIIIPFALGMGLAYYIYESFAPEGVQFASFGLFLGIAMSITAFPVLARIVQERGLHKTRLGTMVITCAAADDITAWCLLAAVIAIVKAGSFVSSLYIIALAAIYVLLMLKLVRPFLKRVGDLYATKEKLSKPVVAIFFVTLIVSSYATEIIGIHALFGAFMAGAIMPDNMRFRTLFIEKVEDVSIVLLLPLFFVFTGLRTQIGLLNDPYLWKVTGLIILVAVVGKFLGSALAAKFVGQNWRDSLTIGALMNTRGLMELVVLNIGFDLGVLTPEVFAMMVIMALVTTFMTGPALNLIDLIFKKPTHETIPAEVIDAGKYKLLFSFGDSQSGKALLRLGNFFTKKQGENALITAMHLTPTNEINHINIENYEKESFEPILNEAKVINQPLSTFFKASNDIDSDITKTANQGDFDLLLIGLGQSMFEGSFLGKILGFTTRIITPDRILNTITGKDNIFEESIFDDRTRQILMKSEVPVGILVDKKFTKADIIFVPIFDKSDAYLINYAQKLIHNNESQITILDSKGLIKNNPEIKEMIRSIEQKAPNHITLLNEQKIEKEFLLKQDLMLISLNSWKKLVETRGIWLSNTPSTLIIQK